MILGFDVSYWQRTLPRINGARFVIVRASYGNGSDSRYPDHVRAARARGLEVGAYHFGTLRHPVADQVAAFLASIARVQPAPKVLVLDVERDGDRPRMTDAQARAFLAAINGPGVRTGLYMSEWEFRDLGQEFDWPANWSREPRWPWELWQHRGAPIDLNWFRGTDAELRAFFAGDSPPTIPKPDPRPVQPTAEGGDPMLNLAPSQTHRDVVLEAGTIMRHQPRASSQRYSRVEEATALGFVGGGYGQAVDWVAVNNGGRAVYVHKRDLRRNDAGGILTIANVRTVEE